MGGNGFPQEIIALFRAIAAERLRCAHLVNGFVHSLDDCGGQGAGDVADAQLDELGVRMCGRVGGHTAGNLGKEVAAGQFLIVAVHFHIVNPPYVYHSGRFLSILFPHCHSFGYRTKGNLSVKMNPTPVGSCTK